MPFEPGLLEIVGRARSEDLLRPLAGALPELGDDRQALTRLAVGTGPGHDLQRRRTSAQCVRADFGQEPVADPLVEEGALDSACMSSMNSRRGTRKYR